MTLHLRILTPTLGLQSSSILLGSNIPATVASQSGTPVLIYMDRIPKTVPSPKHNCRAWPPLNSTAKFSNFFATQVKFRDESILSATEVSVSSRPYPKHTLRIRVCSKIGGTSPRRRLTVCDVPMLINKRTSLQ